MCIELHGNDDLFYLGKLNLLRFNRSHDPIANYKYQNMFYIF